MTGYYYGLSGILTGGHNANGGAVFSIMDDEVVTSASGQYIIVLSRPLGRPRNAVTQNGVTWVDYGRSAFTAVTLRWMTVHPDWSFPLDPDEVHTGWNAEKSSLSYNPALMGMNNQNGFLKDYQPEVHYLTKQQFEALGSNLNANTIPVWQ
jgi:hypothetical protein